MAVVVPAVPKQLRPVLEDSWAGKTTRWTGTERTNNHIKTKLKASQAKFDWTVDFLQAAQLSADDSLLQRHRIHGIRCPKPVGIVTFEDIIDTILQKTSRDENDFFDRPTSTPPTKCKKAGDYSSRPLIGGLAPNSTIPIKPSKSSFSFDNSNTNKLRKRKPSANEHPANFDGVDERSNISDSSFSMKAKKSRKDFVESSYTQNSAGGFHGPNTSGSSIYPAIMLSMMDSEDLAEFANISSSTCTYNPYSPTKISSLPSRKNKNPFGADVENIGTRHVSAAPILPTVRRITPFSRNTESYERSEEAKQKALELVMPTPLTTSTSAEDSPNYEQDDRDVSIFEMDGSIYGGTDFGRDLDYQMSSNLIVMESSDGENDEENSTLFSAFPAPTREHEGCETSKPHDLNIIEEEGQRTSYGGFPQELLDGKDENRAPNYASKTMPRLKGSHSSQSDRDTNAREQSFYDDRAILPSQRNSTASIQSENIVIGARSSSLRW